MLDWLANLDIMLFRAGNRALVNPFMDWLMLFLTNQWATLPFLLPAVVWLAWRRPQTRFWLALLPLVVLLTDQISAQLLKDAIARVRPCAALDAVRMIDGCRGSFSFPGSHATNTFGVAVLMTAACPRGWPFWFGLAAIVSFTRIYLGLHYPSDVIGGALLGAGIGWLVVWSAHRLRRKYRASHTERSDTS